MHFLIVLWAIWFGMLTLPASGQTTPTPVRVLNTVLCDKHDDIMSILVAQQTSVEAGVARFRELAATVVSHNGFDDKACAFIPVNSPGMMMSLVGEVGAVENVHTLSGLATIYVVAVIWYADEGRFPGFIMASKPLVSPGPTGQKL